MRESKTRDFFYNAQQTINEQVKKDRRISAFFARFVVVWTLLSRIPLPRSWWPENVPPGNEALSVAPVAGGILGFINGLVVLVLGVFGLSGYVCGWIGAACYFLIGWGLHLDGWSDLWDGIGSGKRGEELRQIMKDSRVGAYGGAAIVIAFGLWGALVGSIDVPHRLSACVTSAACARFAECVAAYYGDYPWSGGMSSGWVDAFSYDDLIYAALTLLLFVPFSLFNYALCIIISALIGWYMARTMNVKLGGVSGDVMGATAVEAEIASLLVWAVMS